MHNIFNRWANIRIGEILQERGYITQSSLDAAICTQKQTQQKVGEILVEQGVIDEQQLRQALRRQRLMKSLAACILISTAGGLTSSRSTNSREYRQSFHRAKTVGAIGGVEPRANSRSSTQQAVLPQWASNTLESQPHPTTQTPLVGFCHPMNGKGVLSQGNYGFTHRRRMAYAYDLAAPIGTPIYAMRAGKILSIRDRYPDTGGGKSRASKYNYILIQHDGGFRSAYVHLQQHFLKQIPLEEGMVVKAGQLIGFSGNSGWSTGPHLHLEVQSPSSSKRFTKTVPFKVSGRCAPSDIANVFQE